MAVQEGQILWEPTEDEKKKANLTRFIQWVNEKYDVSLKSYDDLWRWSVAEGPSYWEAIWRYFNVVHSKAYSTIRTDASMIETEWFIGAELNYAENAFRNAKSNKIAIYEKSEIRSLRTMTWQQLEEQVAAVSSYLRDIGVQKGDRVAAYLPNFSETIVAFLATASVGAIWSACPPEFGISSTLSRFQQIEPKVLFTVDGYKYNGSGYDKSEDVQQIISEIPSIEHTIIVPYLKDDPQISSVPNPIRWEEVLQVEGTLSFEQVPFEHPLWILYSSGTTGLPKAIVHSQGGMLLSNLSGQILQANIKPDDRYFWYTTTGWMLWNTVVGTLQTGASIILYDGSPTYPTDDTLWQLAEETKMTHLGTSPNYILDMMKKDVKPKENYDLSCLRAFAYTGAPLSPEGFKWVYDEVKADVRLIASAGGTDICGPIVSSTALLPVYAGEIACRALGVSVYSYDEKGNKLIDEEGEMVITKPIPSMPLFFWGDEGQERYKDSYYNVYPNIWRHGDLLKITERGTAVIYGRSDATINRGGVRSGSSELYRVIETFDEILNSLVVDLSGYGRKPLLLLFVELRDGEKLTDQLKKAINEGIRREVSPRHIPNMTYEVSSIPMTITGKKMEIPVREILLGKEAEKVVSVDSMRNPESIDYFKRLAEDIAEDLIAE